MSEENEDQDTNTQQGTENEGSQQTQEENQQSPATPVDNEGDKGVAVLDIDGVVMNTYFGEDAQEKAERVADKHAGWSVRVNE